MAPKTKRHHQRPGVRASRVMQRYVAAEFAPQPLVLSLDLPPNRHPEKDKADAEADASSTGKAGSHVIVLDLT